ncbi:DUF1501 domain-containing protein [Frigoriglobus tundricola]|uniref:Uncharacterized DUF1501 protein, type 2 n=1 Tax=Frigoriglobus tundricola TaxID=2774151 RepID=A0A6M5Z5P9_9BACT|nr:DUF1501 domain-containing protein [Frigoriglobus tundricola]QJX01147.1 Uncharacterized DUF1501 protein, type 2 [Frigoriglobus tundricola]
MLTLSAPRGTRTCDGVTRRELLRAGGIGVAGLTLPGLLKAEDGKAGAPTKRVGTARSVIVFCTNGGTGQHDSFDPKPDAPAEIRGKYTGTDTNVRGIRLNEHLPHLAKQADKFSLIRSLHHTDTVHPSALYWTLCGAKIPRAVTPESATMSREDRPHFGSAATKLLPGRKDLPGFVMMPVAMGPNGPEWPGQFAGFLGAAHDPYRVNSYAGEPNFTPGAVASDPTLPSSRLDARRALLAQVSEGGRHLDAQAATKGLDPHFAKAFDMVSSPAAQKAFDLDAEPKAIREKYGDHTFGQQCLLARRLVEAGVRLVQINWPRSNIGGRGGAGYDTHANGFKLIEDNLYPATDKAFAALFADLHDRGLLDETLVIFFNEFGRTPKINAANGRDHWPFVYSILLGGGGVKGGRVYGASDKVGAYPASDPAKPEDLLATIYHALGIDLDTVLYDALQRPHHLIDGQPIKALLS